MWYVCGVCVCVCVCVCVSVCDIHTYILYVCLCVCIQVCQVFPMIDLQRMFGCGHCEWERCVCVYTCSAECLAERKLSQKIQNACYEMLTTVRNYSALVESI